MLTKRKVKEKDSDLKISSPVSQIDDKNRKKKIKLLLKCFVNSCRKNSPISARNVPQLPERSLFEPRKRSKKRIAISKRRRRRGINYSQIDLATDSEKKLHFVLKLFQTGQEW